MKASPLATQLARQIADYIRTSGLKVGDRLPERRLAEHFRVSRPPVKSALDLLERNAQIGRTPDRGFFVLTSAPVVETQDKADGAATDEALYLEVAEDRLAGRLPDRVSENALLRRYGLKRGQVMRILRRAAEEGWAERLPGHGWTFLPVLASARDFEEAYNFRITIEPAGILQPTFRVDRAALEQCRQQQQAIVDGLGYKLSAAELYDAGSRFHEVVMQCSGNAFLIDGLSRLNRLRRLIEYRRIDDLESWLKRAREHIDLIDLLLADKRQAAAEFMRRHLESGITEKRFDD
jgi:DNA-binding GntR family transcriptional regulator